MAYVLRESCLKDLPAIQSLLMQAHKGITNLPYDHIAAIEMLDRSQGSFTANTQSPQNEIYLFSLEELASGKVIGLSAIKATTGGKGIPHHFFRRSYEEQVIESPPIHYSLGLLSYISYDTGPTEICSLFLDESMRGKGLGSLLSLGRFLYIANQRFRFTQEIIAELRGAITQNGASPFYDGIGAYFFRMPFLDTLEMMKHNPGAILQLMPKHPIYIDLLPKIAQDAIGATHQDTQRALSLLSRIGFQFVDEYDVFDGGPKLSAAQDAIDPIVNSIEAAIHSIEKLDPNSSMMVYASTTSKTPNFRSAKGYISISSGSQSLCRIDEALQKALHLEEGDHIRIWHHHSLSAGSNN